MIRKIIFRNLFQHPLSTLLSLLLLTCGTGIISMLLVMQHQLATKMDRDLQDIDLVVQREVRCNWYFLPFTRWMHLREIYC